MAKKKWGLRWIKSDSSAFSCGSWWSDTITSFPAPSTICSCTNLDWPEPMSTNKISSSSSSAILLTPPPHRAVLQFRTRSPYLAVQAFHVLWRLQKFHRHRTGQLDVLFHQNFLIFLNCRFRFFKNILNDTESL